MRAWTRETSIYDQALPVGALPQGVKWFTFISLASRCSSDEHPNSQRQHWEKYLEISKETYYFIFQGLTVWGYDSQYQPSLQAEILAVWWTRLSRRLWKLQWRRKRGQGQWESTGFQRNDQKGTWEPCHHTCVKILKQTDQLKWIWRLHAVKGIIQSGKSLVLQSIHNRPLCLKPTTY